MKKDKQEDSSSCLIERAVERLMKEEQEKKVPLDYESNVIDFDAKREDKIILSEIIEIKKVK